MNYDIIINISKHPIINLFEPVQPKNDKMFALKKKHRPITIRIISNRTYAGAVYMSHGTSQFSCSWH